jgi:hypothetical protein
MGDGAEDIKKRKNIIRAALRCASGDTGAGTTVALPGSANDLKKSSTSNRPIMEVGESSCSFPEICNGLGIFGKVTEKG